MRYYVFVEILEYLTVNGRSPYREWFDELDAHAATRVAVALTRIGLGNFSNTKGVGAGVLECRIDYGPGYRIYFGRDGERLVILLAAAPRSDNKPTSWPRRNDGPTTKREKRK